MWQWRRIKIRGRPLDWYPKPAAKAAQYERIDARTMFAILEEIN